MHSASLGRSPHQMFRCVKLKKKLFFFGFTNKDFYKPNQTIAYDDLEERISSEINNKTTKILQSNALVNGFK